MFGFGYRQFIAFGGAPVISAVTPNMGSANGGWVFKITLSAPVPSTIYNITIAGQLCTGISYIGSVITATAPAYSTSAGSTTGQTITINTATGSISSSGNLQNYFYLPDHLGEGTPFIAYAHRLDALITQSGGTISDIGDISGNNLDFNQPTALNQPAVLSNFNSSGLPGATFDGASSDYMELTPSGDLTSGGALSSYIVMAMTSNTGTQYPYSFQGSHNYVCEFPFAGSGTFEITDISTNRIGSVGADTNPHVFSLLLDGVLSYIGVDSTQNTGTLLSASPISSAVWLGSYPGGSPSGSCQFACDICYSGAISSTNDATVRSILKTLYGTP